MEEEDTGPAVREMRAQLRPSNEHGSRGARKLRKGKRRRLCSDVACFALGIATAAGCCPLPRWRRRRQDSGSTCTLCSFRGSYLLLSTSQFSSARTSTKRLLRRACTELLYLTICYRYVAEPSRPECMSCCACQISVPSNRSAVRHKFLSRQGGLFA